MINEYIWDADRANVNVCDYGSVVATKRMRKGDEMFMEYGDSYDEHWDDYKNVLARILANALSQLCRMLGCGQAHATLCGQLTQAASSFGGSMRSGTVLERLFVG
jgi:hypothetical protein